MVGTAPDPVVLVPDGAEVAAPLDPEDEFEPWPVEVLLEPAVVTAGAELECEELHAVRNAPTVSTANRDFQARMGFV